MTRVDSRTTYPCYTPSHRVHPSQHTYTHIAGGRRPDSGLNCAPRPLPLGQPVLSLNSNVPSFQSAPDVIKNNQQNATSRKNTNSLLSPPKSTRRQPHPVILHETPCKFPVHFPFTILYSFPTLTCTFYFVLFRFSQSFLFAPMMLNSDKIT